MIQTSPSSQQTSDHGRGRERDGQHAEALARELRLPGAIALVVGQVIAVGLFLTPGTIIKTLASPLGVLLLWTVMGGMALCGALCYGRARSALSTGGRRLHLSA